MHSITSPTLSTCSRIARQIALLAAMLVLMNSLVQAQSTCTAFGNPPRGNVFAVEPLCGLGGSLLGGFNDGDGTPRFACLYPPSAPVAGVRYPMIVFLHASLTNADSVKLTPLFDDRNTSTSAADLLRGSSFWPRKVATPSTSTHFPIIKVRDGTTGTASCRRPAMSP